jgi:4-hydroxy-tetrahydrodipicolinate reductase
MIRYAMAGAGGRMGRAIMALAHAEADFALCSAIDPAFSGQDAGQLAGVPDLNIKVSATPDFSSDVDVLIDFSSIGSTLQLLDYCSRHAIAMVIGVTGFSAEEMEQIKDAAKKIAIFLSPNMSFGVNWLFRLTELSSRVLQGYEVEIVEAHHRHKKDAPSGTANRLRDIIISTRPGSRAIYGREGITGERPASDIGMHAMRGGDIVGEHTVYFIVDGERIELKHVATSRNAFARGALLAARAMAGKPPGFYSMQDILD